jgi:outer membrane immunogenic protein
LCAAHISALRSDPNFQEATMKKTILIASAVILTSGSAFAADAVINEEPAPVAAGFTWSGLYAGIDFGYAAGKSTLSVLGADNPIDPDGFIGGVHIGVNHEMANRFVLGAEADITSSNVEGSTVIGGQLLENELNWSGSARLRAGYAFNRTLPYVTAGVAAANYEVTVIIPVHDETHFGWTAGAGVAHAFTDNWIARLEYRYFDFGSKDLFASPDASVDLQLQDIRVGLSYKF